MGREDDYFFKNIEFGLFLYCLFCKSEEKTDEKTSTLLLPSNAYSAEYSP